MFKQIGQTQPIPCMDPEHYPPAMMVLPAGSMWENTCPSCGLKTLVTEPTVTCTITTKPYEHPTVTLGNMTVEYVPTTAASGNLIPALNSFDNTASSPLTNVVYSESKPKLHYHESHRPTDNCWCKPRVEQVA